jgi:hypothetical protein
MRNPYAPPGSYAQGETARATTQVAGRACAVCAKRIATALDGVACVACNRAYHAQCLEDPDRCVACGQSMSALERVAAEAEAAADQAAWRRGRLLAWAVIVPCALVEASLLVRTIQGGETLAVIPSFVRAAIETFLVWRAFQGTRWAQNAVAFFFGLGAVLAAFEMASATRGGRIGLAAFAAGGAFGIWVFAFSRDARAYFEASSRP